MIKPKYQEKAQKLPTEAYNICFLKGTEPPGSGKYYKHFKEGVYSCIVCNQPLFKSEAKYFSNSGWPSFFEPIEEKVTEQPDHTHGMIRTEILCSNCGSHLGHVFHDGPKPTGLRYCINSLALNFQPAKHKA